jgi:hypothetical protein
VSPRLTDEDRARRELEEARKRAAAEDKPTPQVIATTAVHARHPDTGLDVVFIPGEAVPAWALPPEPEPPAGDGWGSAADDKPKDLEDYTVPELQTLAKMRKIDISHLRLKADIIAALEPTEP